MDSPHGVISSSTSFNIKKGLMRKLTSLLLMALSCLAPLEGAQAPNGTAEEPTIPAEQKDFCSIVQQYRDFANPVQPGNQPDPQSRNDAAESLAV